MWGSLRVARTVANLKVKLVREDLPGVESYIVYVGQRRLGRVGKPQQCDEWRATFVEGDFDTAKAAAEALAERALATPV
jgi:hypothetical protein